MDLLITVFSGFFLAAVVPWLHRLLGDRVGYVVALLPLAIAIHFGRMIGTSAVEDGVVVYYAWVPGLSLSLSFYLDGLSLLFVLLVAGIGMLVMIYASGYLKGDPGLGIFFSYLLAFMSAMLGIVLSGNLLTLYVFWELTTLTSFLLIGFKHEKESARDAALQSLLTTALGGLALLVGLVLLGIAGGSFELAELLGEGEAIQNHAWYPAILSLVLLGAFTKSAQFPFHYWLPNAMEAPTPVSAYLHSATMVKAGVYLLARMLPVLGGTPAWSMSVTTFGAVTMLLGAYLAFYQHDMKRVLAYLTVNVLGSLVMLLGLGTELAVKAAMVYLLAHALYKGALFLMAGAVEHETHTRDIRELGGLWRRMPATTTAAVLAALSMAGVVPLLGFIAKELYLEAVWQAPGTWLPLTIVSMAASIFLIAGAALLIVRPFFGKPSAAVEDAHGAGLLLWVGPLTLAIAGVAAGLFPQRLVTPLIEPAVAGTLGRPVTIKLALWHGLTTTLVLSIIALGAGAALFALREHLLERLPRAAWAQRWGTESWYSRTVAGMNRLASWQTRVLQHGYLRIYVVIIVGVAVVLVTLMIAHIGLPFLQREWVGIYLHEAIAAAMVLMAALVCVRSRSRFRAIASLGVVGFSVSWIYAMFGAPDLAMTQIVVEALTVLLFVLAFYHLPPFTNLSPKQTRLRDAVLSVSAGAAMTVLLLLVTGLREYRPISEYFAQQSYLAAHGRNVVNVILVDFRALDTLGEITVLTTAAVGVFALIKLVVTRNGSK